MRVTNATGYDEPRDSISHDWLDVFARWSVTPCLIPNLGGAAVDYIAGQNLDMIIFSGGEDIGVAPRRDDTEQHILNYALESALPVFGVCRGMQFLNAHFGGTLVPVSGHVATRHRVHISGHWQEAYGADVQVNSYHNLSIRTDGLGAGMMPTAIDDDGYVEAFEHETHPIAAVMWHPERKAGAEGDYACIRQLLTRNGAKN